MSVFDNPDFNELKKKPKKKPAERWENGEYGEVVLEKFLDQLNSFHLLDIREDKELEEILLKQNQYEFEQIGKESEREENIPRYSPSSTNKCMRELFFKYSKESYEKDKITTFPYQTRWRKNGVFCHKRIQEDILYSSKHVPNSSYSPYELPNGLPAWEKQVARYRKIEHKGQIFGLYGMCDGILKGNIDGESDLYLFEYKTKSTTISAISDYQLRRPADDHYYQIQNYFNLFDGLKGCILLYESIAKDSWSKKEQAKEDLKGFYVEPDKEKKNEILDKFSTLTEMINRNEVPPKEEDKCLFCPFKTVCKEIGE